MFCNHCGAKNPDQAASCLTCGQPYAQIPASSVTSDIRSYDQSEVEANVIRRPSDGKYTIFISVVGYLVELAIALLVLFHEYGSKDTTVIVSLLVMAYNMIRAQVSVEGVLSAKFFLDLSKLIQRHEASDEEDESHEDVTSLVRRDLPYAWGGAFFHMALAALAVIKLLLTLLFR
jgi:hypothetical protein